MRILAIAGSLRTESFNLQLAKAAQDYVRRTHPDIGFEILSWDDVPFFNQDIEFPPPAPVARVREEVKHADGLWLFSPEYNHTIPGAFKNLLDWLSRPVSEHEGQVLAGKPVAVSGASPGMSGAIQAQDQLITILSFLRASLMNYPRLTIPHIGDQADDGILKLTDSARYLERQADAFVDFVAVN